MSGDEVWVMLLGGVAGAYAWYRWYVPMLTVRHIRPAPGVTLIASAPVVCAAGLYYVLRTLASWDVQNASAYLTMYLLLGAGWVGLGALLFPFFGLSGRDDVVERGNDAAAPAIAGALAGVTLCYAGGNVGNGPGWWVVLFAAALATGGLGLTWYLLERLSRVSDVVTIDRDYAAGLRLGGFLLAVGLVLGRSVAGDWVSLDATLRDFARFAWPVLVFLAAAALLERGARPTAERPALPVTSLGALPTLVYLAAAIYYVIRLGRPA